MTDLTSFLKCGNQGGTGTGKSTLAALLLLGLSVEYHGKAPVLVFDTEPGWQFIKPMYDAEGVKLVTVHGRHFKGMHDSLKQAIKEGCCGFCVDSITHPWGELLERFADSSGRVPFHKFNQIKPMWNDWIVDFMNAPLNAIANGRLTWEYSYEQAEDGKKELIKGDAKMKAGGSESFGYEPHLTCELTHQRKHLDNGKLGGMEYVCLVLKDRARVINGKEFLFEDFGQYKPGGYKPVLNAFRPHVEFLRQIAGVHMSKDTSEQIIPGGDSEFYRKQQLRKAAIEDWDATMDLLWPSTKATDKMARAIVGEAVTGVRSRTKFEQFSVDKIQECVGTLMALEKRLKAEPASSEDDLRAQVSMAQEDYRNNPQPTLLEARLQQSVKNAKGEEVAVPF